MCSLSQYCCVTQSWCARSRQERPGVATFSAYDDSSGHVNNGYLSVSHFVCVECELTPEKIGVWSRVPDPSKNERASPHDLVEIDVLTCQSQRHQLASISLCRNCRSYLDQKRQGHGLGHIRHTSYPCDLQTLADMVPGVSRSCFPT